MRGKGAEGGTNLRNIRITPAYAGKSDTATTPAATLPDHPRLCGEKAHNSRLALFSPGSPPPMRGKADDISNYYLKLRITPAYAGKRQEVNEWKQKI